MILTQEQQALLNGEKGETMNPDPADVAGFDKFIELYKAGLPIEAAAVSAIK